MSGALRKSKEPSFDEYIFCCDCGDYVYEYCSIHGPLLVVPDDKVPSPTGFPPFVPRAALTLPRALLHLAPSSVPGAGIGVFSSITLPRGVRFGPYRGVKRRYAVSAYCWQIYDRQRARSHVVDAGDAARANWLRYVRCARAANLAAFQYRARTYYRTVRVIPPFMELLVFCGSNCAQAHGADSLSGSETAIEDRKPTDDPEKSINSTAGQPREDPSNHCDKEEEKEQDKLDGSNIQIISNDSEDASTKDECPKVNVNVPQNESYTCDDCKKEFHEKALLISHIAGHNSLKDIITITDNLRWICASCNSKFATKSELINHEIKDHGSKIKYYACTLCNYKTIQNYKLQRHIKTHSKEKYACNICDTKFSSSESLKRHVKNHTRIPYQCKTCNAGFGNSSTLKRHIRIHTGEKPYSCEICHLKFSRSYGLRRHMKTHSGMPYQCEFCNLTFNQRRLVTLHMRIHEAKPKLYMCTVCDSKFTKRSRLLRHSSIHTGIKPFNCTICGSKFIHSSKLKRHQRTHVDKNCIPVLPVTLNVT